MIVTPLRFVLVCRLHAPRSTLDIFRVIWDLLIASCINIPPIIMYNSFQRRTSISTYRTTSSHQETRCCPASRCSGVMRGETENDENWRLGTLPPPRTILATTSRVIGGAAAGGWNPPASQQRRHRRTRSWARRCLDSIRIMTSKSLALIRWSCSAVAHFFGAIFGAPPSYMYHRIRPVGTPRASRRYY